MKNNRVEIIKNIESIDNHLNYRKKNVNVQIKFEFKIKKKISNSTREIRDSSRNILKNNYCKTNYSI